MSENTELLFFDTFSHESNEETNLDLVQFPRPVFIHEIRIIPLGARVQADFPGGHRLGATNPSQFQVEFFVNDLSKRNPCTFEKLGSFEYVQNVEIQFITKKVITDGLILRGWYSTITLAVYGVITNKVREPSSPPPPPPPQTGRPTVKDTRPEYEHHRPVESIPIVPVDWSHQSKPDQHVEAHPLIHPIESVDHHHPTYTDVPPTTYSQYSTQPYTKTWTQEEQFHSAEYEHQQFERRDTSYTHSSSHSWDPSLSESRDKYTPPDLRSSAREHDKDDDRVRDTKRRERDHSWEHASSDKYKEWDQEDRLKDKNRDRNRSHERGRDRGHDLHSRRPVSPKHSRPRSPQTPPLPPPSQVDDFQKGPRTPKEEDDSDITGEPSSTEPKLGDEELFEELSPDQFPEEDLGNLSEGEGNEGYGGQDDGLEEISSEEEYLTDVEGIDLGDMDYEIGDDSWNYMSIFDPFQCELSPLQYFSDPSYTAHEIEKEQVSKSKKDFTEHSENYQKVMDSLAQFSDKNYNDKWVETVELVTRILSSTSATLVEISKGPKYEETLNTLLEWTEEGLDFEAAISQPLPAFKVRHMKAGVKLAYVLFLTDSFIISKLIKRDIPGKLLQLFLAPYMSLPLKLQILRSLDAVVYTRAGYQHLLTHKVAVSLDAQVDIGKHKSYQAEEKKQMLTGYQILLKLLLLKQSTRAVVALSALLKKIHLYECFYNLHMAIDNIINNTKMMENKASEEISQNVLESEAEQDSAISQTDLESIVLSLTEFRRVYKHARREVAQPLRYLPSQTQFEAPKTPFDPFPSLLRMFKENNLMEIICLLVSSPLTTLHTSVMNAVREFLAELLHTQQGMMYLLSNTEAVNCLHRALLQDDDREEGSEDTISHQVGLHLVHHLQALQFVDSLLTYHQKGNKGDLKKELDEAEIVSCLHDLYTIIFTSNGKSAVVKVLSLDHNLDSLIPFLKMTGNEEFDMKLAKSVCAGYAIELVLLTVHHSESATFLHNYASTLNDLSQQELTPRLHELASWMAPTRNLTDFSYESVNYLMKCIKNCIEEAASLPPELVTSLRILQHFALPLYYMKSKHTEVEEEEELKYKYVIVQIASNDGLATFVSILQKICDEFLKPACQTVNLVGFQGDMVVSTVKPMIGILQVMLGYLIKCRGTEFKDLCAVPVLLNLHTLMSMIPVSSASHGHAQQVKVELVETLLTYTQPYLGDTEASEEGLNKSLWTKMIQEILKYTLHFPYTFITGLTVLSELLPLPLPLLVKEALSPEEVLKIVNSRKLWSAHLHSLSGSIQEIIVTLSVSSCPPVQQLLRRVCVQLSDLTAPTAGVVVRAVLDAFLEIVLESSTQEEGAVPTLPPVKPCSSVSARVLNLLSYLVSHAPFKIPLMHILRGSGKADEKYGELLNYLLSILGLVSDKLSHVHSQESLVSILQSLCDIEVGLVTVEDGAPLLEVLANSLPHKDHLAAICTALVQHIGNSNHNYASVLPAIRTLVMLTDHDYGFYHVKTALEKEKSALLSLLSRLSSSFSKDSSDYLSTLSTTLEFIRLLAISEEESESTSDRTLHLSPAEVASLLEYKASSESPLHPVMELGKLLTECDNEEESPESMMSHVTGLIQVLNEGAAGSDKIEKEMTEPNLPAQESLLNQFASRVVFVQGEIDEERLSPSYWLATVTDDADQEPEQVQVDLAALGEKFFPDFNLKAALEKLCLTTEGEGGDKSKKSSVAGVTVAKRKHLSLVGVEHAEPTSKKPFIAPMRGRNFLRGFGHSNRANDPFRSRPPNTSRPPSMHVDDFVAFESNQQPSAATGLKRPIKAKNEHEPPAGGPSKPFHKIHNPQQGSSYFKPFNHRRYTGAIEGGRGRGRGQDNSRVGGRGRFFSPPGPYTRNREGVRLDRDFSNAGNRGGLHGNMTGWNNRQNVSVIGGSGGLSTGIGGSGSSRGFGRGSHVESRTSQRSRDAYGNPNLQNNQGNSGARFSRGMRAGATSSHGHWADTRNQDSRFMSNNNLTRGRRDNSAGRHSRSFAR